jgi:stage II sporulation protein R
MKKIIYIVLIIIVMGLWITSEKSGAIPDDSIRFRIIANSNDRVDQTTKLLIKKELENKFFPLLEASTSKEETTNIIEDNQEVIKSIIEKYNVPYSINYGKNYFPTKTFNDVIYEEGEYESLVISLGEASGNNWWCIMYPPLCLLENNTSQEENIEYKSYLWEIISRLTS